MRARVDTARVEPGQIVELALPRPSCRAPSRRLWPQMRRFSPSAPAITEPAKWPTIRPGLHPRRTAHDRTKRLTMTRPHWAARPAATAAWPAAAGR